MMLDFELIYKGVRIRVEEGDITQARSDAIVNPANSLLLMGGGVAGAIKQKGGSEIEEEALRHAPLPIGKAIATSAGRLRAKHVIHSPTMERPAMRIEAENIRLAMRGALLCANELGIKSIAFPGLGTGVGGVSPKQAAFAMAQELKRYIDGGTSLKEIILVAFTKDLTKAFERAVVEILGS
jgi:O-acetyl-ADP-ribose deacetylase (regulator of RNase III)